MDNAVIKYRQRRQKRLDAKAIDMFKMRRDERLLSRFDDEENENGNNVGGKRGGGHGNTRIPFGLCQREGIRIDPSWTPKDAWDALAGKGYSAGDVYKELQKTGKVGKKSTPKKEPTKLTEAHFPQGMLGSSKKNTMEFAKYINEHCVDPNISEFLSLGNSLKAETARDFKCRKTDKDGESKVSVNGYYTGRLKDVTVTIPLLTKTKDDKVKAAQVRTFTHEWTHYLDLVARDLDLVVRDSAWHFSEQFDALAKAIDSNDGLSVGKEVKEAFDKRNAEFDALFEKQRQEMNDIPRRAAEEMFGGARPAWLREDGTFTMEGYDWRTDHDAYLAFRKYKNKMETEAENRFGNEQHALMDGFENLQGIYDSLSKGRLRDNQTVRYGHSLKYFRSSRRADITEILADYVALSATRPELAEMFRKDKPEIAKALDETIAGIVKKLKE